MERPKNNKHYLTMGAMQRLVLRVFSVLLVPVLLLLMGLASPPPVGAARLEPVGAARLEIDEHTHVDLRVLIQSWALVTEGGSPDGSTDLDFLIRRARLLLLGQVTNKVGFFFQTDAPNLGRDGDWTVANAVSDAFISYQFSQNHILDSGLIVIPFSRHSFQAASSLNAIDVHTPLLRYPQASHSSLRDTGIQYRGGLANGLLQYRFGVFGGIRASRQQDPGEDLAANRPRLVGHVRLNLFDSEPGMYPPGIYFGDRKVVSTGMGVIFQPSAIPTEDGTKDHLALAWDVFVDIPFDNGNRELLFQAGLAWYADRGEAVPAGLGWTIEAGYRMGSLEPLLWWRRFEGKAGTPDSNAIAAGLNLWLRRHVSNLKAELSHTQTDGVDGSNYAALLQAQIFWGPD